MPLDHYPALGRSRTRVSPFALGAATFGEDPGGADCSVERTVEGAPLALDRGMALLGGSTVKAGFLLDKYRRGKQVADSARVDFVGGPDPRHLQRS